MSDACMRLNVCCFGLAVGVVWAAGIFFMGLLAIDGYGAELVRMIGGLYVGYSASFVGSLIGAAWALLDGFIGGVILAWLYNKFSKKCCKASAE